MGKKMVKSAALVAVMGMCFNFVGCGSLGNLGRYGFGLVASAVPYVAYEFLADNNGVFDLFNDGTAQ